MTLKRCFDGAISSPPHGPHQAGDSAQKTVFSP